MKGSRTKILALVLLSITPDMRLLYDCIMLESNLFSRLCV